MLRSLAINPQALIVYDNFNFKNSVRDQVLESSKSIMHNMTSALLVLCSEFSATDLKQFMFNSSQSLSLNEILTALRLQRDDIACQISTYFITTAVQILHSEAVNYIFNDADNQFPQMSQLKLLTSQRTMMQQLRAIFHDEDTIDGTYGVHQDIWIQKLGFKEEDESHHFDECL